MADELTKLKNARTGDNLVLGGDSLAPASPEAKGAVKQGGGVAKNPDPDRMGDKKINTILDSLRQSGVVANDKFVIMYERNFPYGVEEGGSIPVDETVYLSGQTATVKFEDSEERVPYCQGHTFKGWATSASAETPTYPYDENDPQTYTLTFTNNDIVLYAVWEEVTCTLTYALGGYGTGSVPSPQTVAEGNSVEVAGSPAPTVNDGSGRVFIGWSTEDGGDEFDDVLYSAGSTIYLYSDITLYPVFAAQYTLTYALGNDATGSVPSSQSAYNGQTISVDFMTQPTCLSDNTKTFAGWSETDEDSSANYTAMGTSSIYMTSNVTLYPVFEAAASNDYITIDNTANENAGIEVYHEEDKDYVQDTTVMTYGSTNFYFGDREYYITIGSDNSSGYSASFTGTYKGVSYNGATLSLNVGEDPNAAYVVFISAPDGNGWWNFSSGDDGTLSIAYSGGGGH